MLTSLLLQLLRREEDEGSNEANGPTNVSVSVLHLNAQQQEAVGALQLLLSVLQVLRPLLVLLQSADVID